MYYTIYKITNLLNGKIYIGKHKTSDINDEYMGSGKAIKAAIAKYGIENFSKEILSHCENENALNLLESLIVNKEFISRKDTYNIMEGGSGGWSHFLENKEYKQLGREAANKKILEIYGVDNIAKTDKVRKILSVNAKKRYDSGDHPFIYAKASFAGKTHTDKTKRKISEFNKEYQSLHGNSQTDTVWVTNIKEKIAYKIQVTDLENELKNEYVVKKRIIDFERHNRLELAKNNIEIYINLQNIYKFKTIKELYCHIKETASINLDLIEFRKLMNEYKTNSLQTLTKY